MNSDGIQSRQNQEKLLKIQYAARECYNSAEKFNHYAWALCLVTTFSVFFPDGWPTFVRYGVPFIADIVALCLILIVNQKVKMAAILRKYFDAYVLDICPDQFSETELRKIKETAGNIFLRNPQQATIQMTNSGKDSPPGVFNWYDFSESCTGFSAQFECQCQTTWWNSKMFYKRLVATICASVLVGAAFLLLMLSHDIVTVLLSSAGFIIKIVERLFENGKYIKISNCIDGAQKAIEPHPTREGIEKLQDLINKRRSINVLEFNWLHKRTANKLSKSYEDSIS